MKKTEVQQRVLQNGKPLDLDKFSWDEATKTFSTLEDSLVLDFAYIDYCTITTGSRCTIKTGYNCTLKTGYNCTITTGDNSTITTSNCCTITTGDNSTITAGDYCVCVRRDVFEFFQIPVNTKIRLNDFGVKGYEILEEKNNVDN
jgi:hypothetical protein